MSTPSVLSEPGAILPSPHQNRFYSLRSGVSNTQSSISIHGGDGDHAVLEASQIEEQSAVTVQKFSGWKLVWLTYQSIGIVYGDIGTSPLYVFSSTFPQEPSQEDLVGVLSLIIWSLTIMVSMKYVLIVLRANDEGEGGTFALYSLLSRHANILRWDPNEIQRTPANQQPDMHRRGSIITKSLLERSRALQTFLKGIGVLGVSLVIADGILMPAQSVLGAIQGLRVVNPTLDTPVIVGVSCTIIVFLFLVQGLGTTKVGGVFAPIIILWLLFITAFGIYNLVVWDHTVLKAFSPYPAGAYLVRNGTNGWKSLSGVLLAFTGCEALFADLGAFSETAIQISWLFFTYPCLLLAYAGQAAYISVHPSAFNNPFFETIPQGWFWPSFILSILAAIVASQALITATFQILSQMMKVSYAPHFKLVYTSDIFSGQVFCPMANWLLALGCIVVTAAFKDTVKLGHAYGVCVIILTLITTNMVALVALVVWKLPSLLVLFVWLIFVLFDGVFLTSSLTKLSDGAWAVLALALTVSTLFTIWRFGKERQWRAEASDVFPPSHMVRLSEDGFLLLSPAFGGRTISKIHGVGVFFDKTGSHVTTPTVFTHFVRKFRAIPEIVVFFHLRPLQVSTVAHEDRVSVRQCFIVDENEAFVPIPNWYGVIMKHGYNDQIVSNNLGTILCQELRTFLLGQGSDRHVVFSEEHQVTRSHPVIEGLIADSLSLQPPPVVQEKLITLQEAHDNQLVYITGKEELRIKGGKNVLRSLSLRIFLWIRENTRTRIQSFNLEADKLIEVGFVKEI